MSKLKEYPIFSTPTVSFDLDEEQVRKANQWAIKHHCLRKGHYGTVGDKYHFNFVPTGIGTFVSVHCSCGKEKDLTGNI
jgi:hypothetical protein